MELRRSTRIGAGAIVSISETSGQITVWRKMLEVIVHCDPVVASPEPPLLVPRWSGKSVAVGY